MKRLIRRLAGKSSETAPMVCSCCGKDLAGEMPALAFMAPAYWEDDMADKPGCDLNSDFCVIDRETFFTRTVLKIPIIGTDSFLEWGVWASLSQKNFERYVDIFGSKKELKEEPYFGWFSNELPGYPDCLKIKTSVQLSGGGLRPNLILDHDDPHPLCQEQHSGITIERAHELIKQTLGQS